MSDYSDYRDKFTEYDRLYEYSEDPFTMVFNMTGGVVYTNHTDRRYYTTCDHSFSSAINNTHGKIEFTYSSDRSTEGYSIFSLRTLDASGVNIPTYNHISLGENKWRGSDERELILRYNSSIDSADFTARWPLTEDTENNFSLEYSPEGHIILINGKTPTGLHYSSDTNPWMPSNNPIPAGPWCPITIPDPYIQLSMGTLFRGTLRDIKFIDTDTGETSIHYPLSKKSDYAKELIHGLDGEFRNDTFPIDTTDGIKRSSNYVNVMPFPEYLKWGKQLPEYIIPEHPFNQDLGVDLSIPPTDEQIAWLKWKDTGLPALKMDGVWTNHTVAEVERNEKCWYYKKAFTCVSTLAELHWFKTTVTLISPRHVVIAEHVRDDWGPNNGTCDATGYKNRILHFMDMDSNVQTVQAIDHVCLGSDTSILLLAEPITLDIEYAKFLPPYFADNAKCTRPFAITPNREGALVIEDMFQFGAIGLTTEDLETTRYDWSRWTYSGNRIGDSSRPSFIYDGDQLFFCFVATSYSSLKPSNGRGIRGIPARSLGISFFNGEIQQAMNDLDDRNVEYTGVSHCEVQIGEISQEWIRDNM